MIVVEWLVKDLLYHVLYGLYLVVTSHPGPAMVAAPCICLLGVSAVVCGVRARDGIPLPSDRLTRNTAPAVQLGVGLLVMAASVGSLALGSLPLADRRLAFLVLWFPAQLLVGLARLPPQVQRWTDALRLTDPARAWVPLHRCLRRPVHDTYLAIRSGPPPPPRPPPPPAPLPPCGPALYRHPPASVGPKPRPRQLLAALRAPYQQSPSADAPTDPT